MIQRISDGLPMSLPIESKCTVHFIDIEEVNETRRYLNHIWGAGLLGANNIHLVNIKSDQMQLRALMFPEMFDFQRLFFAEHKVHIHVCPLHHHVVFIVYMIRYVCCCTVRLIS